MKIKEQASERHVLTVMVDNEAGILAKIAGLFTARGYNIDSLTVADITDEHDVSRITIVTHGPPEIIDQIHAQLERLVPVHKVTDLTEVGPYVERELALIKVAGTGDARVEALRLADVFRAKVVDTTTHSFVFELTGTPDKINTFVGLMRELGLVEVGRTGIVGMIRARTPPERQTDPATDILKNYVTPACFGVHFSR
jgi:acetolactate synthase-1/3 small subunit